MPPLISFLQQSLIFFAISKLFDSYKTKIILRKLIIGNIIHKGESNFQKKNTLFCSVVLQSQTKYLTQTLVFV